MTIGDLLSRGFVIYQALPQAYTFCTVCQRYRFFVWWQAPSLGIQVSMCRECSTVPKDEEKHVTRFQVLPVKQKKSA